MLNLTLGKKSWPGGRYRSQKAQENTGGHTPSWSARWDTYSFMGCGIVKRGVGGGVWNSQSNPWAICTRVIWINSSPPTSNSGPTESKPLEVGLGTSQQVIFFLTPLLEYNCFTMVCYFLLYNKVNQLYVYIYPHIPSILCLPPTPLGGHKAPS